MVRQETEEEKNRRVTGEASLRGHLTSEEGEEKEASGSSSYVPANKEDDTQLLYAIDLLNGKKPSAQAAANKQAKSNTGVEQGAAN